MAGKSKAVSNVVRFSVRYGPYIIAAVKVAKEPVQKAATKYLNEQKSQKAALDHARTLVDGTILKVIHDDTPTWVVYSADEAVASYPTVPSLSAALVRADLTKRLRPDEVSTPIDKAQASVVKAQTTAIKGRDKVLRKDH